MSASAYPTKLQNGKISPLANYEATVHNARFVNNKKQTFRVFNSSPLRPHSTKLRFRYPKIVPLANTEAVADTSLPIDNEKKTIRNLSEHLIEKAEKLGCQLKKESSLVGKLKSQERIYNSQLSNLQKEIITRVGPSAEENFKFIPKNSASVKGEKDRPITDSEIVLIKSRYAHHFVANSQSSIQTSPSEMKTKIERRLANMQLKRAKYQRHITRAKREIKRLAHYLDSIGWKYDEKPVMLLAMRHWLSE